MVNFINMDNSSIHHSNLNHIFIYHINILKNPCLILLDTSFIFRFCCCNYLKNDRLYMMYVKRVYVRVDINFH